MKVYLTKNLKWKYFMLLAYEKLRHLFKKMFFGVFSIYKTREKEYLNKINVRN